jgi:hypothetical protein
VIGGRCGGGGRLTDGAREEVTDGRWQATSESKTEGMDVTPGDGGHTLSATCDQSHLRSMHLEPSNKENQLSICGGPQHIEITTTDLRTQCAKASTESKFRQLHITQSRLCNTLIFPKEIIFYNINT